MRYKEYTWPHNPETYAVEYRRKVASHKVPFGRYVLQDLGVAGQVLRGEGTFAGQRAYEHFRELAEVFGQSGPGLLVHPVWRTERAYFTSLRLQEAPLPDYVRYAFEFWADGASATGLAVIEGGGVQAVETAGGQVEAGSHIVKKGETLWGIAKRYGVSLTALIGANPQIKNPNLIYPGNRVRIP